MKRAYMRYHWKDMLIGHLTAVVSRIAGRKLGDSRTAEDVSHSELTASADDTA